MKSCKLFSRSILIAVLFPLQLVAQQQLVLRVDFFRCGDFRTDSIEIKEMFMQQNGSIGPEAYLDAFNYGEYRIEAYKSDSTCYFRRGYSSLFNEWKTTSEALTSYRKFEESVLIPYDENLSWIVFSMRDSLDRWHFQKSVSIPAKKAIQFKNLKAYPVKELQVNGPADKKLDILFVPDGYTKNEMNLFKDDCENAMKSILGSQPFNDFKERISFRAVLAPSVESGTDYPHKGVIKNTLLNSSYNTFGTERYLTTFSYHKVMDVASAAPADHIVILVNDGDYGGGGFYNFFSLASAHNVYTNFLIQHEMGHGLSGLGDEYYTSDVAYNSFYNSLAEPWEPNLTTLVDFSSKWDSLLDDNTPVPTPIEGKNCGRIGVFEGGGYSAKGIYRPACDCTMKSVRYNFFCEACKAVVRRTILWYSR